MDRERQRERGQRVREGRDRGREVDAQRERGQRVREGRDRRREVDGQRERQRERGGRE